MCTRDICLLINWPRDVCEMKCRQTHRRGLKRATPSAGDKQTNKKKSRFSEASLFLVGAEHPLSSHEMFSVLCFLIETQKFGIGRLYFVLISILLQRIQNVKHVYFARNLNLYG